MGVDREKFGYTGEFAPRMEWGSGSHLETVYMDLQTGKASTCITRTI